MLNGIDPVIFFQFYKLKEKNTTEPLAESKKDSEKTALPPIPIYLSEIATGLYIESEESHIDIQTSIEADENGGLPDIKQVALGSTVTVNLIGSRESIGLTLLNAMADYVLPKVLSQEYYITYLHGSVTIFKGLLQSYSVVQNNENDLVRIRVEISRGRDDKTKTKTELPKVTPTTENIVLGS